MLLPQSLSRRAWMRTTILAGAAMGLAPRTHAQSAQPDSKAIDTIEKIAAKFMERFDVPGLAVAFSHHGRPVFSSGFGFADVDAKERTEPDHRFRIASISKPITAVAIFRLIEDGKLNLDDRVFGPGRLDLPSGCPKEDQLKEITIHHLLTHTSGGWRNDGADPMFQHPRLEHADLIERTLREAELKNAPGESYAYSNFGYCLLGRLIEKVSGSSYEEYTREQVLKPCGVTGMTLAGDTREDRIDREVVYYGRGQENPYRMKVRRMDAHGGWLANVDDMIRFLVCTDMFQSPPDLLSEQSMKSMFEPTTANPGYACGWGINNAPNWWHGGSLPGTSTIAVRTASGLCWAGFTNCRAKDIAGALDGMMWEMAHAVPEWHA
jgi:CubicO group peptidase (beta-lactamase class C family)